MTFIVIEAEWRLYVWVNQTIVGSDNGLSTVRCQAIIKTNNGSLLSSPLGDKLQRNLNQIEAIFIEENEFENAVCEMAPICLGLNLVCCNNGRVVLKICDNYFFVFHIMTCNLVGHMMDAVSNIHNSQSRSLLMDHLSRVTVSVIVMLITFAR